MIRTIIQIVLVLMILGTIKKIKDNKLKHQIEYYVASIVIYTIIIMFLF